MGDRVNVAVQDGGERVYLYAHWLGYDAPEVVRAALARKERWDDPTYLTRIIFCQMVKGDEGSATGFGIGTKPGDNEYPFIVVDCDKSEVRIESDHRESFARCVPRGEPRSYTFADFAALPKADWGTLDTGLTDDETA